MFPFFFFWFVLNRKGYVYLLSYNLTALHVSGEQKNEPFEMMRMTGLF